MKNIFRISGVIVLILSILLIHSCKKEKPSTITDTDGNIYHTITIGTQLWMVENLKTTKYRNGDSIPNVEDNSNWSNLKTGAYCNYNNNSNNSTSYGRLYNWHAVNDARNIAPTGWHVATDADWTKLITYLGGESVAGGKMKETGIIHWQNPNTGATNKSGFTALPSGYRSITDLGSFSYLGIEGDWWSSTEANTDLAWDRSITNYSEGIYSSSVDENGGLSVRCVWDN